MIKNARTSAAHNPKKLNWRVVRRWSLMLSCAMLMTACANVRQGLWPSSYYECPAPEVYPAQPTQAELIYALNDTYLAWEECRDRVRLF